MNVPSMLVGAFLLLIAGRMDGEILPGIDPELPTPEPVESLPKVEAGSNEGLVEDEILIKKISGFRLEGWSEPVSFESISSHLEIEQELLLPSPATLSAKLAPYVGRSLQTADLLAIADLILLHYDAEGFPVVNVEAPEQDFKDGHLVLWIEVGRVGRVAVGKPKYGDPDVVRKGLLMRQGEYLRRDEIDEQLEWYGRTIFRRPRLFVSPGLEPATADLLIGLEERRPWRVVTGYENSGTDSLGRDRFLLGVAGMAPNEHVVSYQTVVGVPVSSLHAHALSWEIPLHGFHQTIQLNGAYAELSGTSLSRGLFLDNSGTSWSVTGRHRMKLPNWLGLNHYFNSGFELKSTDQFVLFGTGAFSPGTVRLLQGRLDYEMQRRWEDGAVGVQTTLVASPGGLIAGNDDADFKVYDPMADSRYVYARAAGSGWWSPGGDWRIAARGAGQIANSRLLPSEQFFAGGYQTVRGVAEREFFADEGWHTSVELYVPGWRPFAGTGVRVLAFYDYAWLKNRSGFSVSNSLSSAGLGVRAQWNDWVELRLDHGWRLDEGGGRTHFGVQFSY